MLKISIKCKEVYNEETNEFTSVDKTIALEHSLVAISKWESKYHKPFLVSEKDDSSKKTSEETLYYIKCMTITQNVDDYIYNLITEDQLKMITDYISDSSTATWFTEVPSNNSKDVSHEKITSELIYYWMIALEIPFECQRWHLNRLLTLIRICNIKNKPPKKQSTNDILSRNAALNAARRKSMGTKG